MVTKLRVVRVIEAVQFDPAVTPWPAQVYAVDAPETWPSHLRADWSRHSAEFRVERDVYFFHHRIYNELIPIDPGDWIVGHGEYRLGRDTPDGVYSDAAFRKRFAVLP